MLFFGGLFIACVSTLISASSQSSKDAQQSNDILCSTIKCSTDSVCKVVQGRAECVGDETTSSSEDDFCNLPSDTGPCRGYIESYYYNSASGQCEKFVYGGCKGNKNNFQTIEQCETTCKQTATSYGIQSLSTITYGSGSDDKLGDCPIIQKSQINSESCEKLCLSDSECPDDEKCCNNGCDYLCTKPITQQTSVCLLDPNSTQWKCRANDKNFGTKETCEQFCVTNGGGACAEYSCKDQCEYCINVPQICAYPPCPQFTCIRNESCSSSAVKSGYFVQSAHVRVAHLALESDVPDINTQRICHLPSFTGRCRAFLKRWYYTGNGCAEFTYGGCKGNENNFETKEACESRCSGVPACPKDNAGKAPEGCQWAYATKPDGCQETYLNCTEGPCVENPCKGECDYCINDPQPCDSEPCPQYKCNKKESCQISPVARDSGKEFCHLPPVTGKCRAAFTRWYFNKTAEACESFIYGGCGGNENRFDTKILCEKVCKSNPNDKTIVLDDVGKVRTCHLPSVIGPCTTFTNRWYYDVSSCKQFSYGGCQGNENNFESQTDCEKTCANIPACPPLVVPQPLKPGCVLMPETKPNGCQSLRESCPNTACANNPCKGECEICVTDDKQCIQAPCPQYHCEKNQTCLDSRGRNEICQLPPVTGRCRAAFPRWFFNATSEKCEKFTYGGCKGNENRFDTEDDCKKVCKSTTGSKRIISPNLDFDKYRSCRQHASAGDCRDSIKRWFYEYSECREFTYTGCGGNENNFETQNDCLSRCSGVKPCPVFDAPEPLDGCQIVTFLTADQCTKWHYKCTKGACASNPCSSDCENCVNEPKICKKPPCPQYRCERNETCTASQCTNLECKSGYACDMINGTSICVKRSQEMSCNGKLTVGTCRGRYDSYFYDITTGTCNSFTYTGCEGNANRFTSLKSCEEICISNGN